MSEHKHKDPLEQLFLDKSNEFDVGFNPADWNDLENRLDEVDNILMLSRQNRLMRKRFAVVAVVLIVLAGLSFIIYQNYNRINELEAQLIEKKTNNTAGGTFADQNGKREDMIASNAGNSDISSGLALNESLGTQQEQMVAINNRQAGKTSPNKKYSPAIYVSNALRTSKIQPIENLYEGVNEMSEIQPYYASGSESISPSGNTVLFAALVEKGNAPTSPVKSTYNAFSGFAIGLTIGPDFSTAGSLADFYMPGYKIGAMVEYNRNRSFGISVGLIYSKVNYTANGSEYKPPYGFWKYGIIPQETVAACAILSIPVRVKYNFTHLSNSRFYVTAGVSSYIMMNEAYRFNYAQNDASNLPQNWEGQTGTKHWISNATLSIGYEFDLNKTLSLRIEPYLNIPLREVGRGNVELFSTGSLISLNYRFK